MRSLQKSYFKEQIFLQFQYIVALANCNKASIKKSSAHHNFREGFSGFLVSSPNRCFVGAIRSFRWCRAPRASFNSTTDLGGGRCELLQWSPGRFRAF